MATKQKIKYNLTFWQRVELIPIAFLWFFHADRKSRKTWHEVKKGMEKHIHKYTIPNRQGKYLFYDCEHEGCNFTSPDERWLTKPYE